MPLDTPDASMPPSQQLGGHQLVKVKVNIHARGMAPVHLLNFVRDAPSLVDIYLPLVEAQGGQIELVLVCPKGQVFNAAWWERLEAAGLRTVCIRLEDVARFSKEIRKRAEAILSDPAVTRADKIGYFQDMAAMSVRALFAGTGRDQEQTDFACDLAGATVQLLLRHDEILSNLSGLLLSSQNVFDHSVNVCLMSMVLGRRLGLDKMRLQRLGLGTLLHDLGMTQVPPELLEKAGRLSDEELAVVRNHPVWGHKILSCSQSVPYDALSVVLSHHERPDGKGYPQGLSGDAIPFFARVARVVDIFDAMTSPRPYRPVPIPPAKAAASLLEQAGGKLDQEISVQFIRMHRESFA